MSGVPFLLIFALFSVPEVEVRVRPPFAIAPGSFQATILIERHEANRALEWGYTGPESRVSSTQIDGAQRQRVFVPKPWEHLAGGDYVAYAKLTRIVNGRADVSISTQPFRSIYPEDF